MKIYCCGCEKEIKASLTNGADIYPHRKDLASIPFWKCPHCGNYVGCHYKTKKPTTPLGCIPTEELRTIRSRIHSNIDPLWRSGLATRSAIYSKMSEMIGKPFHSAEIRTKEEGKTALLAAMKLVMTT